MLALKQFRSTAAGLADLLNYAALIDGGIVLGKDGSLLAGFSYRADDAAASTHAERNHLTTLVNQYLAKFGAGWAIWVDAIRYASPHYPTPDRSFFPDKISALIDAERRTKFEANDKHFETEYALITGRFRIRVKIGHSGISKGSGAGTSGSGKSSMSREYFPKRRICFRV